MLPNFIERVGKAVEKVLLAYGYKDALQIIEASEILLNISKDEWTCLLKLDSKTIIITNDLVKNNWTLVKI